MPIHQVTHVNHVDETPEGAEPVHPAEPLSALAAAEGRLFKRKFFVRNPKLTNQDAEKFQTVLQWGRNNLDHAGCVDQAEQWKVAANTILKEGKPHAALIGYIVGIWYLRPGKQICPMAVAHAVACAKDAEAPFSTNGMANEVTAWLEVGTLKTGTDEGEASRCCTEGEAAEGEAESVAALRTAWYALFFSLHLNAAAAALKLELWGAAKAACAVVLARDETNSKALFRLAKALDGQMEHKEAASTLMGLIKREPQNREARSLLEEVKVRQAAEKEKYKKLFAGGPAEAAPAAEPTFREAYEEHVRERELNPRVYDDDKALSAEEERERQRFHVDAAEAPPPRGGSVLEAMLAKAKLESEPTPVS